MMAAGTAGLNAPTATPGMLTNAVVGQRGMTHRNGPVEQPDNDVASSTGEFHQWGKPHQLKTTTGRPLAISESPVPPSYYAI